MVEMSVLWLRRSAFLALMAGFAFGADPANVSELRRGFERPPNDARMMVRWWWFGPSVTKPELEREMRFMKEGGIGGFEVQPTYALELDDAAKGIKIFPYMSAEFLDALTFTGEKAKELGLRMDLTLGSGWPFGGPHIPVELASPRLRVARAAPDAMPALQEGEKLIAVFLDGKPVLLADGKVSVPVGASGQAMFFISSHTRQTVKRPAVGAEGFVLNHYDTAAIQAHLKAVGEPMLKALAKTPPYAIFSDSLEVYNSDWTGDFLAEFQKRRGYDLTPYLPALAGDIGPKTGAIRHDWGLTLSELCEDKYLQPLTAWAKAHGTKFRSQTYGIPPVTLSSQRLVDLPEGEGTQWRRFSTTRWASSANHLYGRPVTSSETWTWLHSPVFRATPLDMKAEADLHFLQGVNQLVAHGWPYTPPSVPGAGLAVLRGGGVQSAQPVVDRDAGHHDLLAAHQLDLAAGNAGHRRRGLPADARRLRGLHPGARFGESGDGGIDRAESGAGDSGRRVQLRFHRRWRDRGEGHHAQDPDRGQRGANSAGDVPEDFGVRLKGRQGALHQAAALHGAGTARGRRDAEDSRAFRQVPTHRRGEAGRRAACRAAGGLHPAAGRRRGASQAAVLGHLLPGQHQQSRGERRKRHSAYRECRRHGGIRSPAKRRRQEWTWIWRPTNRACWCSPRRPRRPSPR